MCPCYDDPQVQIMVRRFLDRDSDAFAWLWQRYGERVIGRAIRDFPCASREDVAMAAMVSIWKKRRTLDVEGGPAMVRATMRYFRQTAFRIAANIKNRERRNRRLESDEATTSTPMPMLRTRDQLEALTMSEIRREVVKHLRAIGSDGDLLVIRHIYEWSSSDIAKLFRQAGAPAVEANSINQRLVRAREEIRRRLGLTGTDMMIF